MKFFAFDAGLDEQLKMVQRRIRKLMNGEIAAQLRAAGMDYAKLYGVSLVHLRQFSQELKPGKDLADRLWHRNIRETMILATMVAPKEDFPDALLAQWADGVQHLELAEQLAFNFLGKRPGSGALLEEWLLHPGQYVRYCSLMALGWQLRFVGMEVVPVFKSNLSTIEALAADGGVRRAVVHCLKMGGRFSADLAEPVEVLARKWQDGSDPVLQEAGTEILFELGKS